MSFSPDFVRQYLTEIGRIPLLTRIQEIDLAQQIQQGRRVQEICQTAIEEGDLILQQYDRLLKFKARWRPPNSPLTLPQWAAAAHLDVSTLQQILSQGQRRWAQLAQLEVTELEKITQSSRRAKQQMVEANLRLVVTIAKQYQKRGLDFLDLIQEGNLGLEQAVDKFDPTRGYKFSTYAYWWIRQAMTRAIATHSRTIRLPIHITEQFNKYQKTRHQLSQVYQRTPTLGEIADAMELDAQSLRSLLAQVSQVRRPISLNSTPNTEIEEILENIIPDPQALALQETMGQQEEVQQLLEVLNEQEAEVLKLRFGLNSERQAYSLAKIGQKMGVSRERIRQIESKALKKLRQLKGREAVG